MGRACGPITLVPGVVSARKGVNVTHAQPLLPAITEKDRADVALAAECDADFVALSFVRHAEDVLALRELLAGLASPARVVAKIEKVEATDHLRAIITVSDGVMVARGDYGVEAGIPQVPAMQKRTIRLGEALEGRFDAQHALLIGAILAHLDFLDEQIERLSDAIEEQPRPSQSAVELLRTVGGIETRTAQNILAEIGTDMTVFPSRPPRLLGGERSERAGVFGPSGTRDELEAWLAEAGMLDVSTRSDGAPAHFSARGNPEHT